MGVIGLWNLIEDAGTNVNVETLRGKVLAIDLSIWINQSIKGFRDKDGRMVENSHLLGLFYRVSKLLFYHIKPIFVFDGECPTLKLRTLHRRQEKTKNALAKSKDLSLNVLEKFVSSQLGLNPSESIVNSTRRKLTQAEKQSFMSELFLPHHNNNGRSKQVDIYQEFVELSEQIKNRISDDDDDEDKDEKKCFDNDPDELQYHHPSHQHIRDIDFNSLEFKSLPTHTRYELLVEIRDSYKGRKNPFPEMLPTDSDTFSSYQMKKLLKKRDLQQEIDKLIDELNGVCHEYDFKSLKASSNCDISANSLITGGRLASDEGTHFVLIKNSSSSSLKPDLNNSEIDTTSKDEIKEEPFLINTENLAYSLPNNLPGSEDLNAKTSTMDRIEHLSKQQQSLSSSTDKLNSKQLIGHLDENVNKFTKLKSPKISESTNLDLSDSASSEDDTDDFIEVPVESTVSSSDDNDENETMFEDLCSLPFKTDYKMDIVVKENDSLIESMDDSTFEPSIIDQTIDLEEETNKMDTEMTSQSLNFEKEKIETTKSDILIDNSNDNITTIEAKSSSIPKTTTIEKVTEPLNIEELVQNVKESAKLTRQAATVTQQMILECQELLRLFGVPWLVAPAEAEAQCATLESLGLSHGTITDDSDVFLFGGKTVYRNFFTNSKYITRYTGEDLEKFYGLKQSKLICLGMMCGTDYTLGIDRVGPVTGLEILSEFPGDGLTPLQDFASWYQQKLFSPTGNHKPENSIRAKFLKLLIPSTFPNHVIYDAYYNASVDTSQESFSWTSPQLSELRQFASCRFGWSQAKTDSIILPVLKSINDTQVQSRIDFFFPSMTKNSSITETLRIKRSKRLNEAIRRNIGDQHLNSGSTANKRNDNKRPKKRPMRIRVDNSRSKSGGARNSGDQAANLVLSEESSSSSD